MGTGSSAQVLVWRRASTAAPVILPDPQQKMISTPFNVPGMAWSLIGV
jgi:hypothetical protein